MADFQLVPLTTAPAQRLVVTLGGQTCVLRVFTKSINVPVAPPGAIATDPPVYENVDPVFVDLLKVPAAGGDALPVVLGVVGENRVPLVRDAYLGFLGELMFVDTVGSDDPFGLPRTLPSYYLQNAYQRGLPRGPGNVPADVALLGTCPGLGTRFLLTYWPGGAP